MVKSTKAQSDALDQKTLLERSSTPLQQTSWSDPRSAGWDVSGIGVVNPCQVVKLLEIKEATLVRAIAEHDERGVLPSGWGRLLWLLAKGVNYADAVPLRRINVYKLRRDMYFNRKQLGLLLGISVKLVDNISRTTTEHRYRKSRLILQLLEGSPKVVGNLLLDYVEVFELVPENQKEFNLVREKMSWRWRE